MSLAKRMGAFVRGVFGLFIGGLEERNPNVLFEDIENQVKKVRREMEQRIIDIQTNAELIKIEMENAERNLREIEKKIEIAQRQCDKDVLIELLMQEEEYRDTSSTYKTVHENAMAEVAKIIEGHRIFEAEMNAKLSELRTLKSKAKIAALRENINSVNAGYSLRNSRISSVNAGMDRVREIVDRKTAKANAIEYLSSENPGAKLIRLNTKAARDNACVRAEAMLNGEFGGKN